MTKVYKKLGGGVPFARKAPYSYQDTQYEADIKNGDIVKILDEGVFEENRYGGENHIFKIQTRNGERRLSINQKSKNVLIDEFGDDTEDWINKDVKVILKKDIIADKKVIIAFLVTEGWQLDDYGDLEKISTGAKTGSAKKKTASKGDPEVDTIEYPEDDINPDDIPFDM